MIRKAVPALENALALSRSPRGGRPSGEDRLPEGILTLIRLVAGDEQAIAEARAETGEGTQVLRDAANFYIQQVLFAKDASSYRVLGVDRDASDERIREHYRWLARWLHPDRNPDAWEVVFSERVSQAWQNMRTPDRRARYDEVLSDASPGQAEPDLPQAPAAVVRAPPRAAIYEAPPPGASLRWVPRVVFGSLGVAFVGVVAIFSLVKLSERGATQTVAVAAAEPSPISLESPKAEPTMAEVPVPSSSSILDEVDRSAMEIAGSVPVAAVPSAALPAAAIAEAPVPAPVLPPPAQIAPKIRPQATPTSPPAMAAAEIAAPAPLAATPRRGRQVSAPPTAPTPEPATRGPVAVAVSDVEPQAAVAPIANATAGGLSIGQRDANRLISHFSRAYEDGDIEGMRGMFTSDIQGSQGGLREILEGYERLFGDSTERRLSVRDVNYFSTGETLTIIASYSAVVTRTRNGKSRHTTGNLRLDLRRENEEWRVFRLRHDERQG